jgi:hypothetical protein
MGLKELSFERLEATQEPHRGAQMRVSPAVMGKLPIRRFIHQIVGYSCGDGSDFNHIKTAFDPQFFDHISASGKGGDFGFERRVELIAFWRSRGLGYRLQVGRAHLCGQWQG